MPSPFNWNGYSVAIFNLLTTELNSLANSNANVLSTLGATFDNTKGGGGASDGDTNMDVEFLAGAGFSPTGGFIELWMLRLADGTNTPDGSSTIAPGRPADLVIPVRGGTTITPRADVGWPSLVLPPGKYKPIARNQTGATLPASGNLIRGRPYSLQQ